MVPLALFLTTVTNTPKSITTMTIKQAAAIIMKTVCFGPDLGNVGSSAAEKKQKHKVLA